MTGRAIDKTLFWIALNILQFGELLVDHLMHASYPLAPQASKRPSQVAHAAGLRYYNSGNEGSLATRPEGSVLSLRQNLIAHVSEER
jgi:hypothetical protein